MPLWIKDVFYTPRGKLDIENDRGKIGELKY